MMPRGPRENLVGRKFGRWTVLAFADFDGHEAFSKLGGAIWCQLRRTLGTPLNEAWMVCGEGADDRCKKEFTRWLLEEKT